MCIYTLAKYICNHTEILIAPEDRCPAYASHQPSGEDYSPPTDLQPVSHPTPCWIGTTGQCCTALVNMYAERLEELRKSYRAIGTTFFEHPGALQFREFGLSDEQKTALIEEFEVEMWDGVPQAASWIEQAKRTLEFMRRRIEDFGRVDGVPELLLEEEMEVGKFFEGLKELVLQMQVRVEETRSAVATVCEFRGGETREQAGERWVEAGWWVRRFVERLDGMKIGYTEEDERFVEEFLGHWKEDDGEGSEGGVFVGGSRYVMAARPSAEDAMRSRPSNEVDE